MSEPNSRDIEKAEEIAVRYNSENLLMIQQLTRGLAEYRVELTAELGATIASLRDALQQIEKRDWVENALDPQWAVKVARAALSSCTKDASKAATL